MPDTILSPDQIDILNQSDKVVPVVDTSGNVLGQIVHGWFSRERIDQAEQALDHDEPGLTTSEVLKKLRGLEPT